MHTHRYAVGCRRGALVVAATAGLVLLVAACGASPSSAGSAGSPGTGGSPGPVVGSAGSGGSPNAGGSTQAQQNIAFARCMRSHGVTDFPDPGSNGQFGTISAQLEDSPDFGTSYSACKHLLPDRGVSKEQQDLAQLLKFAQCMRSHGVPAYPDPSVSPYSSISNTTINSLAGIDHNSPQVQAALQACERANPVGSASSP